MVQKAKEQGDFLLVGLHTDEDVSERRGLHLPIMDLHERCLSVLACKYVDEVIIGGRPHLWCSITCSMSCRKDYLSLLGFRLLPEEAPILIAEKRAISFFFFFSLLVPTVNPPAHCAV